MFAKIKLGTSLLILVFLRYTVSAFAPHGHTSAPAGTFNKIFLYKIVAFK